MSEDQTKPVFSIRPEPTPEEMAAIVAAVTAAMGTQTSGEPEPASATKPSRWARAGRHEAMQGLHQSEKF